MDFPDFPKTDADVVPAMRRDDALNRARAVFSAHCGMIEQAAAQRKPATMMELRLMEFEAVAAIAKALGV